MSDNVITNPLADLIRDLATKTVDNEVTARFQRRMKTSGRKYVLCDLSGSMDDYVGSHQMTKLDLLKVAVKDVLITHPNINIIGFSDRAFPVAPDKIDSMKTIGGTALHEALAYITPFRPLQTIVISDGLPDWADMAINAVKAMTGTVDVIYCGPDGFKEGLEFMQSLTRAGGGSTVQWSVETQGAVVAAARIRGLLR